MLRRTFEIPRRSLDTSPTLMSPRLITSLERTKVIIRLRNSLLTWIYPVHTMIHYRSITPSIWLEWMYRRIVRSPGTYEGYNQTKVAANREHEMTFVRARKTMHSPHVFAWLPPDSAFVCSDTLCLRTPPVFIYVTVPTHYYPPLIIYNTI